MSLKDKIEKGREKTQNLAQTPKTNDIQKKDVLTEAPTTPAASAEVSPAEAKPVEIKAEEKPLVEDKKPVEDKKVEEPVEVKKVDEVNKADKKADEQKNSVPIITIEDLQEPFPNRGKSETKRERNLTDVLLTENTENIQSYVSNAPSNGDQKSSVEVSSGEINTDLSSVDLSTLSPSPDKENEVKTDNTQKGDETPAQGSAGAPKEEESTNKEKTIQDYINDLGNEDRETRLNAIDKLGEAVEKGIDISSAVPALTKCLEDENADVRINAVWALRRAPSYGADISPAVPALAKCLEDKNTHVRLFAVATLRNAAAHRVGIYLAIPALAKCLEDEDESVRGTAIEALRNAATQVDISPAVPALAKYLEDKTKHPSLRQDASDALVRAAFNGVNIFAAVPALTKCLNDKDEDKEVRNNARYALEAFEKNQKVILDEKAAVHDTVVIQRPKVETQKEGEKTGLGTKTEVKPNEPEEKVGAVAGGEKAADGTVKVETQKEGEKTGSETKTEEKQNETKPKEESKLLEKVKKIAKYVGISTAVLAASAAVVYAIYTIYTYRAKIESYLDKVKPAAVEKTQETPREDPIDLFVREYERLKEKAEAIK